MLSNIAAGFHRESNTSDSSAESAGRRWWTQSANELVVHKDFYHGPLSRRHSRNLHVNIICDPSDGIVKTWSRFAGGVGILFKNAGKHGRCEHLDCHISIEV
jgi:hypothetical protein